MDTLIKKFSESTTPVTQEITIKMDLGEWYRAGGDCLCPGCRQPYNRHKSVEGMEYMTLLCNDQLVKL
jgi:hypothetical protein